MDLLNLVNNSNSNLEHVMQVVRHFFPYAQKQLGFHKPVMVSFQSDEENANKLLGKTGYYNPDDFSIAIYVDGRHPKDVLRSLSHELVHHTQNCNGDFDSTEQLGPGYAQENEAMRNAELDAYKRGNIIFRDFEDLIKKGAIKVNINFEETGEPKMSLKEWKDNELNTLLMKKWGLLKEGAKPDFLDVDKDGDKKEPMKSAAEEAGAGGESEEVEEGYYRDDDDDDLEEGMFAPNHYCIHHGGVQHEGHIHMAEAVAHNYDRELNRVTHYDMQLEDGTLLKAVPAEDIQATNASLAEGHGHPPARREEEEESDPEVARAYGVGPKAGTKPEPARDRMEIPAWKDKDVPPPGANVAGTKWQKAKTHKKLQPASVRETKETLTLDDARDVARRIFEKINKGKK